ncbi:MAG: ribonuclease PH [Clostridium perfringens]|nr:ribonuclease PH [Clostridium perfringens]
MRKDNRKSNQIRKIVITRDYIKYAEGSVFIEVGDTKVICTASIEDKVPSFLRGQNKGWITAEYNMLPRSTQIRRQRDITKLKADGRATEIQRLIGRSLRSVVNMEALRGRTIWIDCDVIQADGGTRTAAITGSFIALVDAVNSIHKKKPFNVYPIRNFVSAISVGIVDNEKLIDLCYDEDSIASVDMNIVMTEEGKVIEIQGTGEEKPFSMDDLNELLKLGEKGIKQIVQIQKNVLKNDCLFIGTGGNNFENNSSK